MPSTQRAGSVRNGYLALVGKAGSKCMSSTEEMLTRSESSISCARGIQVARDQQYAISPGSIVKAGVLTVSLPPAKDRPESGGSIPRVHGPIAVVVVDAHLGDLGVEIGLRSGPGPDERFSMRNVSSVTVSRVLL